MVLNTTSELAMLYLFFLVGVKMDTNLILKPKRDAVRIGMTGLILPWVLVACATHYLRPYTSIGEMGPFFIMFCLSLSLSPFPAIANIMDELNLLTSEMGKLAVSCAMVNDMVSWVVLIITAALLQRTLMASISAVASTGAFFILITHVMRPVVVGIIENTPEGGVVSQSWVVIILLGVLVNAFIGDVIGLTPNIGAFGLGVIIPEGSTLGIALVEKTETIVTEFLLPFFFLRCGLYTNIFSVRNAKNFLALQVIMLMGSVGKLVGTILPCNLNAQNALSLGLIMICKGIFNISLFLTWRFYRLIDEESFTIFVVSNLLLTVIIAPLLTTLYKPPRYFATHAAGLSLQNIRPNHELRIIACLHDERIVNDIISIIEASYPARETPIYAYVLHLVNLVGRSVAVVADPSTVYRCSTHKPTKSDYIMSAFKKYSDCTHGTVGFRPLTVIAPYKSMHEDICKIAHDNRAALILLPFHRNDHMLGSSTAALSTLTHNVLAGAPCSVALLVNRGYKYCRFAVQEHFSYSVLLLFFGGPDDREALAFASRMSTHPGLSVTVIRFQFSDDDDNDNERERQLDYSVLHEFKLKNFTNESAMFREEVVNDIEEALLLIRSLKSKYDLVIVGRRNWTCKALTGDMADWSENTELGVLGDIIASSDLLDNEYNLLVMQARM
ncbi:PREDICTED: cation/H(+) antiporter 15-like [Nelumbo nucifera]|nr:PREDICTED: cation/H(+) antiporter 15-like [Nelumbo nucifera]